jgi:membrane protein
MRPRVKLKNIFPLLKETAGEWVEDKAPRLGAALAYYTVFSIAPLLIIAITITGLVFADSQQQVLSEVRKLMGDKGAEAIQSMITAAQKPAQSIVATILGFVTLFFGAAGVVIQLKDALNTIWDVENAPSGGLMGFVKKYFLSFGVVLGIGFLLLVSLLLEAGLAVVGQFVKDNMPALGVFMQVGGLVISFGAITLLFGMLFKFLPDIKVAWRDVWIGALLTSGLFVVGKIGLGLYLGKAAAASAYGAAGSLVIMLLWIYYSAQILFFGAEFTQVYSRRHGSRYDPKAGPKKLSPKEKLTAQIEAERDRAASVFNKVNVKRKPRALARFEHHRRGSL